ncbi:MAG: LysM peptidoglycan-binding domain-containing protein [Candidatus Cloacimonadaceae bacterium]|nr:LysM peptidoglycan-binding domain-containing protein [Candidatus Cloacimonadaceae bacterium]MDP3114611.1 LysM peptidoglycan-binding domain-containing protein [Candidatus Cloacimonadaceae bacterium]
MILKLNRTQKDMGMRSTPPAMKPKLWLMALLVLILPLLMAAEYQTHTVKKGDTLYALSKKYGVSIDQIKKLNNMQRDNLALNQRLKIKEIKPAPKPAARPALKPVTPETIAAPPPITIPERVPETPIPSPPVISTEIRPVEPSGEPTDWRKIRLPEDYYHTVVAQDNLFRISQNNNITTKDVLAWNGFENLQHVIRPGDKIIIKDPRNYKLPPVPETSIPAQTQISASTSAAPDTLIIQRIYVVQPKDTLYRIATNNGITVDELKRMNNLSTNDIKVGQRIYLAGTPPAGSAVFTGTPLTEQEMETKGSIRSDLIMPVEGKVISEYGLRNGRPHKGIDIGAKSGTPIHAVLDGTVVFSGNQGNYGKVVVLEHPDFVMTVYAHNESNVVNVGEVVKQGQMIANLGSTGNASGPHLHFEYRIKGKAINPRKVLPLN